MKYFVLFGTVVLLGISTFSTSIDAAELKLTDQEMLETSGSGAGNFHMHALRWYRSPIKSLQLEQEEKWQGVRARMKRPSEESRSMKRKEPARSSEKYIEPHDVMSPQKKHVISEALYDE